MGLLAYVSMGGVLASGVVVCCVVWVRAFDGVRFHEKRRLVNWSGHAHCRELVCLLLLWSFSLSYVVHLHEEQD